MSTSSSNPPTSDSLPSSPSTLPTFLPPLLLATIPILLLLPPRKIDLYTFALGGTWLATANYTRTQRGWFMTPERQRIIEENGVDGRRSRRGGGGEELQRLQELRAERERERDVGGEIMQRVWDVWAGRDGGAEGRGGDETSSGSGAETGGKS